MDKSYKPQAIEEQLYKKWLDEKHFAVRKTTSHKKRFVIMMPPPNVTGNLHLGHALTFAIEDAMVRFYKQMGSAALWLPGYDHAGIATQVVVERELKKKGISRHKLGREAFVKEVWKWVKTYRANIEAQIKKLGALPDWSRTRFTFDEGYQESVKEAFLRLYNEGLIYRGERMINWCARCQTVLSDLEVEYQEELAQLYYIRYGDITIATVRPEPIPGDVAIAVHPKDKRYAAFVGKSVPLPILSRNVPVIADEAVDPDFGTGAIKVTPAHDPVDFEMAGRHKLPRIQVIGFDNTLTSEAGLYAGLGVAEARQKIVEDIRQAGLLEKIENYTHRKGYCSRCNTPVEPQVSLQWFVSMKSLAEPLIDGAKKGEIQFVPSRFKRVFLHWLTNIQDWCISRQLWWGHQIPVYYCKRESANSKFEVRSSKQTPNNKKTGDCFVVAKEKPKTCPFCKRCNMRQDEDVLDTWFSSSLWPFATLGWPQKTTDFTTFYPTDVLESGYDILFFWVARMLMMGKKLTGKLPFRTVYLHGLVRDKQGRKMSKSIGNVVDPLESIAQYGADALRFALLYGNSPGNDLTFDHSHLVGGRNFANKLWNVGRFIHMQFDGTILFDTNFPKGVLLDAADRAFLKSLGALERSVKSHVAHFRFAQALGAIHNFAWHELADNYLEHAKTSNSSAKYKLLAFAFSSLLSLLHPFMPFVSEAIKQELFS